MELILRLTKRAGEKQTASALVPQWFGAENPNETHNRLQKHEARGNNGWRELAQRRSTFTVCWTTIPLQTEMAVCLNAASQRCKQRVRFRRIARTDTARIQFLRFSNVYQVRNAACRYRLRDVLRTIKIIVREVQCRWIEYETFWSVYFQMLNAHKIWLKYFKTIGKM